MNKLTELIGNGEKVLITNAEELIKEIHEKDTIEDRLEQDVEKLKQSIIHIKEIFDKLTGQADVELYIEPSYMIDWDHLIYVRKQSVKPVSSLANKKIIGKDSKDPNQWQKLSFGNFSSSSDSSDDEGNSSTMVTIEYKL